MKSANSTAMVCECVLITSLATMTHTSTFKARPSPYPPSIHPSIHPSLNPSIPQSILIPLMPFSLSPHITFARLLCA
jgi:hypothetical protein